jgi:phosphoribosyl 1,2-cyclic phosphodiesterase
MTFQKKMTENMLNFWGVVGSSPVSCSKNRKYGSHTICESLTMGSEAAFIIDAGTGIIRLGNLLTSQKSASVQNIHLLFTHFHLDHIIGLPFFKPLYSPDVHITFYSPWSTQETQKELQDLMVGRRYPIDFEDTLSQKKYCQLNPGTTGVAAVAVSWCPLNHPQASVAYRLEYQDRSYVLATDTEHPADGLDQNLLDFCREADVLVYDAMYTPEEYLERKGWGHSTWLQGTQLAEAAGVKELFLSHLNPDHSGDRLDKIQNLAREKFPRTHLAQEYPILL